MKKVQASTIHRIPITKARINLGQVVRRAYMNKEYFILEKDGIPVAGLLAADELEDYLELRDPGIRDQIRKSTEQYRKGRSKPAQDLLSEFALTKAPRPRRGQRG